MELSGCGILRWRYASCFNKARRAIDEKMTMSSLVLVGTGLLTLCLIWGAWMALKPEGYAESVNRANKEAPVFTSTSYLFLDEEQKVGEYNTVKQEQVQKETQPRSSVENVNVTLPSYYRLGKRIENWDKDRELWMSRNPRIKNVTAEGRPRLFMVTGSQPGPCKKPIADHFLLRAFKNKVDYCRLHGVDIFYNVALLDPAMDSFWAKLPLLRAAMVAHPEAEWLWWIDSDAIVTDMNFEIPLEKYTDYNLVVHGWENLVFGNRSWVGVNAGSFLLRNCGWTLRFMERWASMGGPLGPIRVAAGRMQSELLPDRPQDWPGDDQSALIYLMIKERSEWGGKIHIESSYNLNGYWLQIVDSYEEIERSDESRMGEERMKRPFVTHFTGCQPCSGRHNEKYEEKQCEEGMERALNFADNQVLRRYGFRHAKLGTPVVNRIVE